MTEKLFTCEQCGHTFKRECADEEVSAEYGQMFPIDAQFDEPVVMVCGDCYWKFVAWAKERGFM